MREPFSTTQTGDSDMEKEPSFTYKCATCLTTGHALEDMIFDQCKDCTDYQVCEHCDNYFHPDDLENGLCETCIDRLRDERIQEERFENSHQNN